MSLQTFKKLQINFSSVSRVIPKKNLEKITLQKSIYNSKIIREHFNAEKMYEMSLLKYKDSDKLGLKEYSIFQSFLKHHFK